MGAGSDKEHHKQDAAEAYIVYKLQELAVSLGVAITNDVAEKQKYFKDYCYVRDIAKDFDTCDYKLNIDKVLADIFSDIVKKYSGQNFDFVNVEKEFRDANKKGDFIIRFEDQSYTSVSLKNYKKGFDRIQLCSGTWNSFLNNFLFESAGGGMFFDPFSNTTFKGSNRAKRNNLIEIMGYAPLIPVYEYCDGVNDKLKKDYVLSENGRFWSNISRQWEKDCKETGLKVCKMITEALDSLPKEMVKKRIVHMTGLNYDEELLLIGKGKYVFSLTNNKYAEILNRVKYCSVKYAVQRKSVMFTLYDDNGIIVEIKVPFTLQKNGSWFLPDQPYSGTFFHPKEKIDLQYGERRPKKSKEINTSINTYLDLKKAGVC